MRNHIRKIIFVLALGTFLHFIFGLFPNRLLVGWYSAVNESVWEHLKLLFFPMALVAVYEKIHNHAHGLYLYFMSSNIGMVFILTTYYTYSGIFGRHFLMIDILIYILAVALSFFIVSIGEESIKKEKCGFIGYLLLTAIFIIFTFLPPHIPLFMDPMTGAYGI